MKTVAIITARGGSKRIPRKNIKDFLGKPIMAYSIESAINSGLFDEVMVSTDDQEIAECAKKYGAKVPFMRSAETANDTATTAEVLFEVINKYQEIGQSFDYACCLYPTAPFINPDKLKIAFDILVKNQVHSVVPVVQFSYPIQRALKIENDKLSMVYPENLNVRSQDLMPTYHDIGQYYWLKVESFLNNPVLFSDNTSAIKVSELDEQDIDTEEDWKIAEMKYEFLKLYNKNK